jgi:glycosyltransferase involved in cell wall biosynthesis
MSVPLNILQVNTFDIGGGSARVAWNLFASYRQRGHGSWLAVGRKRSADPGVVLVADAYPRGPWFRVWRGIESRLERRQSKANHPRLLGALAYLAHLLAEPGGVVDYLGGREDLHHPGTWRLPALAGRKLDVIHAHNLHGGYFDLRALSWLSRQYPVALTLHDAWLLSGHCAHSFECEAWQTGCGDCPDLTIYPAIRRDATRFNWGRKRSVYARSELSVATPSRWLMHKVERSMLAPAVKDARVIPNGVDLSVFRPADASSARAALGLPEDAGVLLFAAESVQQNRWKDYPTLRASVEIAAQQLHPRPIICIGLGEAAASESIGRASARFVAYETNPWRVAQYYQAADIYVHPARQDTFPCTVIEAMACGTPVVATAVGGIPEQVDDGQSGFLLPAGDSVELAKRVVQVLNDPELRRTLAAGALEAARTRFDLRSQVDTSLDWYRELIDRRARRAQPACHGPHA